MKQQLASGKMKAEHFKMTTQDISNMRESVAQAMVDGVDENIRKNSPNKIVDQDKVRAKQSLQRSYKEQIALAKIDNSFNGKTNDGVKKLLWGPPENS
jgi:hypothetical protein